jgi:hypothetical protein
MANLTAKRSNFITRSVQNVVAALAVIEELRALRREADVLGYATVLGDADFVGSNDHLAMADLVAAFVTIDAIIALLEANGDAHYANLYRLKR